MTARRWAPALGAMLLGAGLAFAGGGPREDNPKIDVSGFEREVFAATRLREERLLSEAEFIRRAAEPGVVVLDARSRDKYAELHVRGALSLPFTDFTAASLAAAIPDPGTPILIYCNNNFAGAEGPFPTKVASAALNLSTFVALHSYGYRNVWELGPLVDVADTRIRLAGEAAD